MSEAKEQGVSVHYHTDARRPLYATVSRGQWFVDVYRFGGKSTVRRKVDSHFFIVEPDGLQDLFPPDVAEDLRVALGVADSITPDEGPY